ncbi:MAG: phosphatase [Oscillospiraceae bacterium]|nr:phosphatase [Oscillospiraceae bacterium]
MEEQHQKASMICGIVDLGSNTVRLSVYRCENGAGHLLLHRKTVAGLAGYIEKGSLQPEGVQVICRILAGYRDLLNHLEIQQMHVFATASLRNISNTQQVVEQIVQKTGVTVDVISGKTEAEMSFRGAMLGQAPSSGLLVDLGGGSTELLCYRDGAVLSASSLPIGSLNLFHQYVSALHPTGAECKAIQAQVLEQLKREHTDVQPVEHICGVGGTVRAAARVANYFSRQDETRQVLTAKELKLLLKRLKRMERETLLGILKAAPERIHTLVPGVLVLDAICQIYGAKDITVSACGVREGYLYQRILEER